MSRFIVLYNYNKYYNRIIKKLSTYEEYKSLITPLGSTPAQYRGFELTGSNFSFDDGVFAKHVINTANMESFYQIEQPDYLVLEQEYKEGQEIVKRVSRWFVLETTKTRGGQFELSLRRDLLADYFNEVVNAPVFIQRGNPGINDPAIFNRESFTYNQIKKFEFLLNNHKRSGRKGGWIVGYLARESTPGPIGPCEGQAKIPNDVVNFEDLPEELQSLIDTGSGYKYRNEARTFFYFRHRPIGQSYDNSSAVLINDYNNDVTVSKYADSSELELGYVYFKNLSNLTWDSNSIKNTVKNVYNTFKSEVAYLNKVKNWYDSLGLQNRFSGDYSGYNGITYRRNGKYYQLGITSTGTSSSPQVVFKLSEILSGASDLALSLRQFYQDYLYNGESIIYNPNVNQSYNSAYVQAMEDIYYFESTEVEYDKVSTTIPAGRNTNLDAPYDLFCIPIGPVNVKLSGSIQFTNAENIALAIAQGIAVKGGSKVYDIQILPYCPFDEILNEDGDIDITGFTADEDYSYITKTTNGTSTNVGILIFPKSCRGTFDYTFNPRGPEVVPFVAKTVTNPIDKKVNSETKLVRFVSPNFASTFDINVQKNNGIVNLNIDYFYKPYSPYLHVAPYFNGLYGEDFNDPKGLICSGDFSIATAQSQWENYQIQNKNYELIFNRQIQNLDVNNSIAMEQQKIASGIGVGTAGLTGVAAGAVAGSMALPGIGTAVGAVVGGIGSAVASGVGRKYDLEYLKKSQTEARSFAQDMYAYSLGNIQALPYTLTRVSAFTENNKIFPFIEFYDATDEEKEALRNKIKYNGMTIMRIGKIADFITTTHRYVQGQLIRLEGINEDSHVIAEIANEIKEGAYYYGYDSIGS